MSSSEARVGAGDDDRETTDAAKRANGSRRVEDANDESCDECERDRSDGE